MKLAIKAPIQRVPTVFCIGSIALLLMLSLCASTSIGQVEMTSQSYLDLREVDRQSDKANLRDVSLSDGALRMTTIGEDAYISFRPRLAKDLPLLEIGRQFRWFTIEMSASRGTEATLLLYIDDGESIRVTVPIVADGETHRYTIDLSQAFLAVMMSGSLQSANRHLERVCFSPSDVAGASVGISAMGFGTTPLGSALIEVASLRTKPGLVRANEEVELILELRNNGGEASTSTVAMIGGAQVQVPLISPGRTMTVTSSASFSEPGNHKMRISIEGGYDEVMSVTVYNDPSDIRQWRVAEFTFTSEATYSDPFSSSVVSAVFVGPDGVEYTVPGFYDGGSTWRIRFTPTAPGEWYYRTVCVNTEDAGLHGREGKFIAGPAEGDNPLYVHGGILQISSNKRYLTYSDGTPFFWLGDTWWFCPSDLVPLRGSTYPDYDSMYKTLVDRRKSQGFSILQMAFLGSNGVINNLVSSSLSSGLREESIEYWQEVDEYIMYANEAGLIPVIGLAFHTGMDQLSLEQWKNVWRYVIARYSAFSITWLITGEYNLNNLPERVEKVMALGQAIKDMDPYERAMSVHAWYFGGEQRQAWDEPWYDFIMLQGGHGSGDANPSLPPESVYLDAYNRKDTKPVLESECNYEGIHGMTDASVRLCAYRAIQLGSFGYTYGAQGLWYPTQDESDKKFEEWGAPIPWWKALMQPGATQMGYMRTFYESIEWWKLEPRPGAVSTSRKLPSRNQILTKADGDRLFVVYMPSGFYSQADATLNGMDSSKTYTARWFNPRSGEFTLCQERIDVSGDRWTLPERPDSEDWLLVIEQRG